MQYNAVYCYILKRSVVSEYQSGTRISYSSDYVTAGGIEAVCLVLVFPTLKMRLNLNNT